MFLELAKADRVQRDLFSLLDSAGSQALMQAMDGLNRRYGRDTPHNRHGRPPPGLGTA